MTLPIETCAYANRWRHRHPGEKAFFAAAMILLNFAMPPAGSLLIAATVSAAALWGARIPLTTYAALNAPPALFAILSSLTLCLGLRIDTHGLHLLMLPSQVPFAAKLACRTVAASSALIFFALTTPAADWFPLLKSLGLPPILRDMVLLLYRFISIFIGHLGTMRMAHSSRLGYATRANTLRTSGLMGANLLVQMLSSARRLEMGLAARGCSGELQILPVQYKLSPAVMAMIAALTLALGLIGMALKGCLP